jgi:hypothetical protein
MQEANIALRGGLGEINQKTDSIVHAIQPLPALKSQVEVLQAQVVGLCSGQEHGTPSPELLAHLTEAQRAKDRLVAQTEVLQASNEHNAKRDRDLQVVLNRINSEMVTMRRVMQTQGEGVGEQVQEGFTGLREELTAHREHVNDTQEQIWAHAQFLEENIDLLGVKLSEIKAQMAGPRPTPTLAAPQVQHTHSVQVHAAHPVPAHQNSPEAPAGGGGL